MLALRWHGNRDLRIDEVPLPKLKPGWVKVKNEWAGICGSDLHEYTVGPKNVPLKPHVLTGETVPSIMGHEFSGTIAEVGEGVTDIEVGQKVAVFPVLRDEACHWCEEEVYGLCKGWGFLGYSGYGGGFAEYICIDGKAIHKIPDNVSLEVAALVEPLAVAWHAVKIGDLKQSDLALVVGAGPIGIAVIHCLQAHGIKSIFVSEPSTARAQHAKEAGATHVLDPSKVDVAAFCSGLGDGDGVHCVFECAGVQAGFDVSLASVRGKGKIVNVSVYETPLVIQTPNILNRRSITYVGSNIYTRGEFQDVINAIASGKIKNPEKMITAKVPLQNAVKDGFDVLLAKKDEHVKILVNASRKMD